MEIAMKRKPTTKAQAHLANVLEWAVGNRGSKEGNPYSIPEIKAALKYLAKLEGITDWLDVDTARISQPVSGI